MTKIEAAMTSHRPMSGMSMPNAIPLLNASVSGTIPRASTVYPCASASSAHRFVTMSAIRMRTRSTPAVVSFFSIPVPWSGATAARPA